MIFLEKNLRELLLTFICGTSFCTSESSGFAQLADACKVLGTIGVLKEENMEGDLL